MQGRYSNDLLHIPKICREECLKLSPADAPDQGITTAPRKSPRFLPCDSLVCLCPECGARTASLFKPPLKTVLTHRFGYPIRGYADSWKCAKCWGLTWNSTQTKGTVAAMKAARPRDWTDFLKLHPQWRKCKPPEYSARDQAFADFQKQRHRSYRKKAEKETSRGKFLNSCR
jgi:hypothetical protein